MHRPALLPAAVRSARTRTDTPLLPAGLCAELLARIFWQAGVHRRRSASRAPTVWPVAAYPTRGDVDASPTDKEPCVPRVVLRLVQAVLEHDQVNTGPLLTWASATLDRAAPPDDEDQAALQALTLPDVVPNHEDCADDVALNVALAAAEEGHIEPWQLPL